MTAGEAAAGPVITVVGSHRATAAPEIAEVALEAQANGAARAAVVEQVTALAAAVRDRLLVLHDADAGPITEWSSQAVQVWSERPWNEQGKQLPLVHHARIGLRATFTDFEALGRELEALGAIEGVAVQGIAWRLREQSRLALLAEVQRAAVADAVAKAQNYAAALGLSRVRALALADPGLLAEAGPAPAPQYRGKAMLAMAADSAAEGGIELRPEELAFTVEVEARFQAS